MKRKPQPDPVDGIVTGGDNNDENLEDSKKKMRTEEDHCRVDGAAPPNTVSKRPAPKYGSKDYWEARYKSHLPGVEVMPKNAKVNGVSECNSDSTAIEKYERTNKGEISYVLDNVVLSKEATKPGHEWYFSYDELRPLILPLILGNTENEVMVNEYTEDNESWVEEEDDGNESEEISNTEHNENHSDGGENKEKPILCDKEGTAANDESHEDNSASKNAEDDSEEENYKASFLTGELDQTKCRPKRVLEVGCGDMPLGTSLVSDLISMQTDTGLNCQFVVEEVACIDYSENVVRRLIENQKGTLAKDNTQPQTPSVNELQPTFRALDARSLPFPSNTYDLILEKGTLDAMLSDEEEGLDNCIQIVKEMARVTSEGGTILIVSHLNANEPKGMGWLEDVVFRGLKDEFLERHQKEKSETKKAKAPEIDDNAREYVWSVEVHGSGGQHLDANGDEIEGKVDEDAVPIYGPAVYIIRKKGVPASIARELFSKKKKGGSAEGEGDNTKCEATNEDDEENVMPPVKLEFLTYEG
eukprot:CAMPEP_0172531968 /NCGR_PEP_ID=MMETSP1067-20121228/5178_1 /TAXON_ID=265564 ORGANISM="Thalassiosira punctigera, Strain Tpunct2005C2" /NCGR_SAMPLE_ID=MMETSP1067 /ASSEMBLY_ACC=CAM_ASM_000444 /LENGTH=528 /DNA_ID=CAMNT_0013316415 /DNA_START=152 /DNA_END=1738 /DNA_ORIENTATION=-